MFQDLVFVKTFAYTVMYGDYLVIPEVRRTRQPFAKCETLNACALYGCDPEAFEMRREDAIC